jgi:hypothetical protein
MNQTAETIPTDDLTEARKIQVTVVWRIWNAEFQAAMRSCVVVMMNVGSKHRVEMSAPGDQQPIEALLFTALIQRSPTAFTLGARMGVRIT